MPSFDLSHIFHPSDFSKADQVAFLHALRLALAAGGELDIFHADPDSSEVEWDEFPSVRRALEKWGQIPKGGSKEDVRRLGVEVHKVKRSGNPVQTILEYLADHEPDLIVLSTGQRRGLSRWMIPSIAEPVARHSRLMTLLVPRRTVGFISPDSGAIQLENVLIPIDHYPSPTNAVLAATALVRTLKVAKARFVFLHVGRQSDIPPVQPPRELGWTHETRAVSGDVVDRILEVAEETDADLIVMATQGRDGFLDALRGSTTERVLRQARCPLLAVPA